MAVALKIGVGYLLTEFLTHTFVILGAFKAAGAVTAGAFKPRLNGIGNLLIFVYCNFQIKHPLILYHIRQ